MVDRKGSSTEAIQRLLDERLKIMQWLDRLNVTAEDIPDEVRVKVRRDYESRLESVAQGLRGYQDNLQQSLVDHQGKRTELLGAEEHAETRMAEAKLRHAVGEFEESQWNTMHSEIMAELVKVRESLQGTDEEIHRLEDVLGAIRTAPSTEVRKAIPMPEPPPLEEVETVTAAPAPAPAPASTPAPAPPDPTPAREPQPRPVPAAVGPQPPQRQTDAFDELAFLKSVTEDEQQGPAASDATGTEVTHGSDPSGAAPGAASVETVRTDPSAPAGPKKTLKCGECGVMNFPTEWYCERCGAELAAL